MGRAAGGSRFDVVPLLVGGAILAGFLGLAAIWFAGTYPADVPGLFDYPSAYLGDSVLLPVAATLLTIGVRRLHPAAGERLVVAVVGLLAGGGMIATQLLWLADDNPESNWTLPQPHQFNLAGVWHAGYAVGVAVVIAVLVGLLACRVRAALGGTAEATVVAEQAGRPAVAATLACLFSYGVLAVHDSLAPTFASRTSLVALVAVVVGLTLAAAWVLGRRLALMARPALTAVVAAAAVGLAVTAPWQTGAMDLLGMAGAVLAGVGAAVLLLVPARRQEYRRVVPAEHRAGMVVAALILAVLLPAVWAWAAAEIRQSNWIPAGAWLLGYALALVVVPALLLPDGRMRWVRDAAGVLLTFWLLAAISLLSLTASYWYEADAQYVVVLVVAILTSGFLFQTVWLRFEPVLQAEQDGGGPDGRFQLTGETRLGSVMALTLLVVSGIAAGFSLLSFTLEVAFAAGREFEAGGGTLPELVVLVVWGVGLLLASGAILVAKSRRGDGRRWRLVAPLFCAAWAGVLLYTVGVHGLPPITPIAVLGALVLGLWAANTAINNVALLNGDQVDATMFGYAGAAAASGFLTGYTAMTVALAGSPDQVYGWFSGIVVGAVLLSIHGGLTVTGGLLASLPDAGRTRHSLPHNLLQDASVMTILYWVALVIPAATMLHLPAEDGTPARFLALIVICAPFLTYFLRVYLTVSSTNMAHLVREIESRAEDAAATVAVVERNRSVWRRNAVLVRAARGRLDGPEQHRFLQVLGAHLRNQNALARIAAALFVVGILVQLDHIVHRPDLPGTLAGLTALRQRARSVPAPADPPKPEEPIRAGSGADG